MFSRVTLFLLVGILLAPPSFSQVRSARVAASPIDLVDISAPTRLSVGAVGHFRVQVSETTSQPVNYLWDLGDGTLSMGSPVSHVYAAPGQYTVTVVGRNANAEDTLRATVTVADSVSAPVQWPPEISQPVSIEDRGTAVEEVAPENAPEPVRVSRSDLYGSGGLRSAEGAYTWVVRSDLWGERARDQMLRYRLRGFRTDVYVDSTGRGSPAYRVVVGQFSTSAEAVAVRPWLPDTKTAWLLKVETSEFASDGR